MLAILTTHPIQYQVPLWKALSARGKVPFRVFYMSDLGFGRRFDPGFGRSFAWDIDLLSGYESEFIDVHERASQNSFFWLSLRPSFKKILRDSGVDALWVQGWQVAAYWQAVWEARRAGVEVWLRGETNQRSNGKRVPSIKRPVLRRFLGHVDQFLYIGEANRQFYLAQGVEADRMVHAPYCVDNARFASQASLLKKDRLTLRRQWNIPDDAFCCLFVGKLIPKKRPNDLVAAVYGLQKRGTWPPLHILFVGTGELGDQLRQLCRVAFDAEGHGSGGSEKSTAASFAGFLNQTKVSQAYVAADCLVLPSDASETWGLVVNEAMASGLPCITSDTCGCTDDLIRPIRPGLSYPVGDIGCLQQSLEVVKTDPPPSSLLKNHIDDYDVLRAVESVERLYARRNH